MGSENIKLPLINLSNIKEQSPTWEVAKSQVLQALQEYGCFEATFDRVPINLRKSVIEGLKQLFDLPLENKLRNRSNTPYHGYVGQYAMVPLYESLGLQDALSPGKIKSFTNLMWAQGNPTFSEAIETFSEQLSELDKIVRRMVLESLGLEKYMDEHLGSTNYLVRVQKYDGPKTHEPKLGLTAHTDKNIVTILYGNEVRGLQVLTKDGKWINAEPSLNSFIVMIGDSFHAWTNGRLHSPYHKVMMTGDENRYSIGLFSIPKSGYIIKAPDEMVDEDHPLLFKPFDHIKFLDFYYSEAGRSSPAALKAYCGA
ncbi:2-oxoglutarate (2OG) and Fe(II)-dependent oxygenase superfamily protein [Striga hermonthica]|uniref:2-oxoglutarate (2OG) and Fe(II)-dependent oxygenase superfamily protein n=1 Tax=Striga hermonthica TaxID=68872 RepID=A0A9N7RNG7_STRHE|nr:2-oxoglutarate (2OG) and Fe(II)-dependent oxygenase superfamily protein [Striga hermonthica]